MKSRLASWLLIALFPLAGAAQQPLPSLAPVQAHGKTPLVDELLALDASPSTLPQGAPVVPIWSGADGQLLAVVALPRELNHSPIDPTPGYAGPSSWYLAGSSTASAGGLSWQLGNGFRADAVLGQYLATPSANCTSSDCNAAVVTPWARNSMTGAVGLGWTGVDGALDLSYGLSWLQSQPSNVRAFGQQPLSLGDGVVPVLTLPGGLNSYGLDSETSLYARGRWQFENGPALDLSASYGRGRLSALGQGGLPGIDLDQLSLSLGLGAGSLRGAIVGHVLRSDDPMFAGKRWTTLDLGVSWRTPWSGELSVGTQNILNAPLNTPRDADGQQNRTPYIQYRQDL
ncbi:hypothetical protein [Dokdonella sp.]|uniref:hypothetical protein n=1 Tax=Dokdonella sp. TaxID=2291710 RepID=UPI001B096492|nr:hypothetical protein [Dokdonella sp.]MBO9664584.1 hypothetical protein [Dokdonella sp.]